MTYSKCKYSMWHYSNVDVAVRRYCEEAEIVKPQYSLSENGNLSKIPLQQSQKAVKLSSNLMRRSIWRGSFRNVWYSLMISVVMSKCGCLTQSVWYSDSVHYCSLWQLNLILLLMTHHLWNWLMMQSVLLKSMQRESNDWNEEASEGWLYDSILVSDISDQSCIIRHRYSVVLQWNSDKVSKWNHIHYSINTVTEEKTKSDD